MHYKQLSEYSSIGPLDLGLTSSPKEDGKSIFDTQEYSMGYDDGLKDARDLDEVELKAAASHHVDSPIDQCRIEDWISPIRLDDRIDIWETILEPRLKDDYEVDFDQHEDDEEFFDINLYLMGWLEAVNNVYLYGPFEAE